MPEFNDWFPVSRYGTSTLNVKDFGALGDGSAATLGSTYGTLAAAQADYPSATALTETKDWAGITECFKQAFSTGGVPHGSEAYRNSPVCFPPGRYGINKPLYLESVEGAFIYGDGGTGGVRIYNSATTAPDNICFKLNGFKFARIECIDFHATGVDSLAVDVNSDGGAGYGGVSTVSTSGNIWIACTFTAPLGIGIGFGRSGFMGSEQVLVRCNAVDCSVGFCIMNANALNYTFIAGGGYNCTDACYRINTGGMVFITNAALATNDWDIANYAGGTVVVTQTRTESGKFVKCAGNTLITGCTQNYTGNDSVFAEVGGPVTISNCQTDMGKLTGEGTLKLDNASFNMYGLFGAGITAIGAGASGKIRLTIGAHFAGRTWFSTGDEVKVFGCAGSAGATAANGLWTVTSIDATHIDLEGSTFTAGAYTGGSGHVGPGPRYHLKSFAGKVTPDLARDVQETKIANFTPLWADSGMVYDNKGATGEVVFTLPNTIFTNSRDVRGIKYKFVVLAAQNLKIVADATNSPPYLTARIFRAGGYATPGTTLTSNVIGNSVELYLADGEDGIGHRWLVRSETGTWTLSGTPA